MTRTWSTHPRRRAGWIAGALTCLSWGEARAQQATALDRFAPTTSDGASSVPWAEIEGPSTRLGASVVFSHADTLLAIQDTDDERRIAAPVGHQSVLHAVAGVNVAGRLHVGASFPFVLSQGGETSALGGAPDGATVGDLRLASRVAFPLLPRRALTLSLGADVWLPTGDDEAFASSGTVRVAPRLLVGGASERVVGSIVAGPRLAPGGDEALVGSEIELGGALGVRLGPVVVGPEVLAHVGVDRRDARVDEVAGLEARLAAQAAWGPIRLGLAGGPGFGEAPGVPRFRIVASLGAALDVGGDPPTSSASDAPPSSSSAVAPAPIAPAHAAAPPLTPPIASAPTPPTPTPAAATAPPSPDPSAAAPPSPPALSISGDQIVALEPIRFETGTARIEASSDALLDRIAALFEAHPELARVAVDGHTDARGDARRNTDLSRQRALAVLRALVSRGVDARRLEARGFGPSRPIASEDTDAGRAQNRRVEFVVRRRTDRGREGWVDGPVD